MFSIYLKTLLLSSVAEALVFEGPTPTVWRTPGIGAQVLSRPTASTWTSKNVIELRQDISSTSLATCGWIGGNSGLSKSDLRWIGDPSQSHLLTRTTADPVTCGPSLYCATTSTFVGCCAVSSCLDIFTTCYDFLGGACDVACQYNPLNLVCPTNKPYCALFNYPSSSVGYGCAEYSGLTTTVLLETMSSAFGTLAETTPSHDSTIQRTPTTSTTSSTTSSKTAQTSASEPSHLGIGTIAGIAVGGVVAVAAVCYLVFLAWLHSYKKRETNRHSYTSSATTLQDPTRYSGTKFVFPSPRSPPWEWGYVDGHDFRPVEMPTESGASHELEAVHR